MNDPVRHETPRLNDVPPAGRPEGDMSQRGGRVDIEDKPGKSLVEEAAEESFPASDPPSYTPAGYDRSPPPFKKRDPDGSQ